MLYQTTGIDECSFIITAGLSINSVQSILTSAFTAPLSVNDAAVSVGTLQITAAEVVSRTF